MPILLLAQLAFQAVFPGPLWGNLTPGSYGVGYMTQFVVDENRQWGPIPRQLPLLIFYPTTQRSPISTFRNYLELGEPADASRQIVSLMRERDLDTARRQFSPPDSGLFERLLDTPVAGARNATLAAGRFPLVLYALGLNDYQQENTVLWEFLTSHGFVVVVVPQLGESAEAFRMRFGAEAMRLQAADLMLVAARMRAAPYVAPLSPAYVGHSSGALAGFLAAQAMGASGVVSLDGDLTTPSGAALLTGDLGGRSTNFPILALHKVVPEPSVTLSFVGSLPTRNWAIGFSKATHFDFQNWALFGDLFNREDPRAGQLRDMKTGATIYRSMCRLTLAFLQEPGEPNSRLKAEIEMLQQAGSGAVTIEPGR